MKLVLVRGQDEHGIWRIFMSQLAWGHRVPLMVLGVPLRMFSDEINICICRLSKADFSPQCVWASPIHSRPAQNKRLSENKFSLSALLPLNWDIDFLLPSDSNLD